MSNSRLAHQPPAGMGLKLLNEQDLSATDIAKKTGIGSYVSLSRLLA